MWLGARVVCDAVGLMLAKSLRLGPLLNGWITDQRAKPCRFSNLFTALLKTAQLFKGRASKVP